MPFRLVSLKQRTASNHGSTASPSTIVAMSSNVKQQRQVFNNSRKLVAKYKIVYTKRRWLIQDVEEGTCLLKMMKEFMNED